MSSSRLPYVRRKLSIRRVSLTRGQGPDHGPDLLLCTERVMPGLGLLLGHIGLEWLGSRLQSALSNPPSACVSETAFYFRAKLRGTVFQKLAGLPLPQPN